MRRFEFTQSTTASPDQIFIVLPTLDSQFFSRSFRPSRYLHAAKCHFRAPTAPPPYTDHRLTSQPRPELAHHQGYFPAADLAWAARLPLPLRKPRAPRSLRAAAARFGSQVSGAARGGGAARRQRWSACNLTLQIYVDLHFPVPAVNVLPACLLMPTAASPAALHWQHHVCGEKKRCLSSVQSA